jgi:uncharacterized protein (TIGR02646 family)
MILVKRTPKPTVLARHEAAWTRAITSATSKKARDKALAKYRHPAIKQALEIMFHGKCAFCEAYISHVDYGDIEHFCPKSKFPELAVAWDNLLLACKRCNGAEQKGDQWPSPAEGGPLVNPVTEPPEDFFEFEFDEQTLVTVVKPKSPRGATSERIYGLNRANLLKSRNNFVRKLVAIAEDYHRNPKAKEIIDEATESGSEYAAFARMVKQKYTTLA